MKITIIGTGYVGLVQGLAFTKMGYDVICCDTNEDKISLLKDGKAPFYEPHMESVLNEAIENNRIEFTTDIDYAVVEGEFIFIAVPTPTATTGDCDLTYLFLALKTIIASISTDKIIVIKSTIQVGTTRKIEQWIQEQIREQLFKIRVVFNPEFLAQGSAVHDALHPQRIVLGVENNETEKILLQFYKQYQDDTPILIVSYETAEMIKYASNAFLATKISFINLISNICDSFGANVEDVARGMKLDPRIGNRFLSAGIGFGGSCFPKDTKAMIHLGKTNNINVSLLEAVMDINRERIYIACQKIESILGGDKNQNIAILGLSFKPNTDDLREAPSLQLIEELLKKNYMVRTYDPVITSLPQIEDRNLECCDDLNQCIEEADIVVIVTEWESIRNLDLQQLPRKCRKANLLDLRNIFDSQKVIDSGVNYYSIGNQKIKSNKEDTLAYNK